MTDVDPADSNWLPAYILLLIIAVAYPGICIFSIHRSRRQRAADRTNDIELQPQFERWWFPWRQAVMETELEDQVVHGTSRVQHNAGSGLTQSSGTNSEYGPSPWRKTPLAASRNTATTGESSRLASSLGTAILAANNSPGLCSAGGRDLISGSCGKPGDYWDFSSKYGGNPYTQTPSHRRYAVGDDEDDGEQRDARRGRESSVSSVSSVVAVVDEPSWVVRN
jgi:hypothetical protein